MAIVIVTELLGTKKIATLFSNVKEEWKSSKNGYLLTERRRCKQKQPMLVCRFKWRPFVRCFDGASLLSANFFAGFSQRLFGGRYH